MECLAAEIHQFDQYAQQDMFGDPCPPPASIFYWVLWIYKIKEEEETRKKAGAVCDGSTHVEQAQVHDPTYAPTPV